MIRTSIAAAIVYIFGLPYFDAYRPAMLKEPMQSFYVEINAAARYCWHALPSINVARAKQYLNAYVERTIAEVRRSSH